MSSRSANRKTRPSASSSPQILSPETLPSPSPKTSGLVRARKNGLLARNGSNGRRKSALERLGVTLEQMRGVQVITPMLEHAEGGLDTVLMALRASGNADAVSFIQKYDSLSPTDQNHLSIEEVSIAAAVPTLQLLAVATVALVNHGNSVSE